ncbi:AraC family transcriptional regulator [Aquimarina algiphila]|uniref:AraC family transcriptional regulator n=1 Tax=Aquimarina algiphila TaxID=2047982 RepID=UPI0024915B7A|nr:AraC family transcriptional regulator [Aquimarina algiphila]
MKRVVLVFSIIFLTIIHGVAQDKGFKIPDSLKNRSFDEIEGLLNKSYGDSIQFSFYTDILLTISKEKRDELKLAKAYMIKSYNFLNAPYIRLSYLDSSIAVSKNLNDRQFPTTSYSLRGSLYKELGEYSKALDNYLIALKLSKKTNSTGFYYLTKHNIASLRQEIGDFEEAAIMYKEVLDYEDENNINDKGHLATMFSLATTYRKLEDYNSSSIYNKKGIKLSIENNLDIYHSFVLNEGINLFYKKKYQSSFDSIQKALPFFDKLQSKNDLLFSGHLHLAKLYRKQSNAEKSLEHLLKMNEYYERADFTPVEMRRGYEMLISYYKTKDDKTKQLYYINKLFKVDSILDSNYKNLSRKMVREYDTPRLLEEKQDLIDDLELKEKRTSVKLFIAIIITLLLIIFVVLVYIKNIRYKKRFEELMKTSSAEIEVKETRQLKNSSSPEAIGISKDIVKIVLSGLQKFEDKEGYLSSNITTGDLAKQLKTNSKYLSKIINTYKQKSFSVYINELRIEYVIDKLKNDSKFRLYTIKAISREIGFNTTEAFSKSFYKKTGIYPSYFIKQLEK